MRIEHFQFKKSGQGTEYVTFTEGITKTGQSRLHDKHRLVIPKCFLQTMNVVLVVFSSYIYLKDLNVYKTIVRFTYPIL